MTLTTLAPVKESATLSASRLHSIDVLRALAALVVVFYHSRIIFWVGLSAFYHAHGKSLSPNVLAGYLTAPMLFGGLGVQLFFVLSGYCIHRRGAMSLAKNPDAKLSLWPFMVRRFWRIYPVYVAALLWAWGVDVIVHSHASGVDVNMDHSLRTFLVNLMTLQGFAGGKFGTNPVFWTLAVEMHFYLVYPLLFAASQKFGAMRTLVATLCVSITAVVAFHALHLERFMYQMGTRTPIFLMYWFTWTAGFFVAEIEAGRVRAPRRWGMAAMICAVVGLGLGVKNQFDYAEFFFAVAFSWLVYRAIESSAADYWRGAVTKSLAGIGVFSYSLYAFHYPVLMLIQTVFSPDGKKFDSIWPAVIASVAAVPVAWIFFGLVERWTLTPPKWLTGTTAASAAGTATASQ